MMSRHAGGSLLGRGIAAVILLQLSQCWRSPSVSPDDAGRSASPPTATWLDGTNVQVFGPGSFIGHFLGAGHVSGIGRLSRDGGLFTFDDGILWVSIPGEAGLGLRRVEAGTPFSATAKTMALAQVSAWHELPLQSDSHLGTLAPFVRRAAAGQGCSAPYIFRIQGRLSRLDLAPPAVSRLGPVEATLVGVVDASLPGAAPRSAMQVHAIVSAQKVSGFARAATFAQGSRLLVPVCRPPGYLLR
ncbi:MAG: hypothetical protein AAF449_00520 [Myxococcota bacterium]